MKRCIVLAVSLFFSVASHAFDCVRGSSHGGNLRFELRREKLGPVSEAWKDSQQRLIEAGLLKERVSRLIPVAALQAGGYSLPEIEEYWATLETEPVPHAYLQILFMVADAIEEAHGANAAGFWLGEQLSRSSLGLAMALEGRPLPTEEWLTPGTISVWEFHDLAQLVSEFGMDDSKRDTAYFAPAFLSLQILAEQLGAVSFDAYYRSYATRVLPAVSDGTVSVSGGGFPLFVSRTWDTYVEQLTLGFELLPSAQARPPLGILARLSSPEAFEGYGEAAIHAIITSDGGIIAGALSLRAESVRRLLAALKAFNEATTSIQRETPALSEE